MIIRYLYDIFNQELTHIACPNVPVYKYGFFNQWQTEPLWK
jgi:hypothetical protein